MKQIIYYIDDIESDDISNKLKEIIKDFSRQYDFIALTGEKHRNSVLKIQNGNIEENSLVFLDADLSYFNDPNNFSCNDIKTSEIIKAVTKNKSNIIILSVFSKEDIIEKLNICHNQGAFSYVNKSQLLECSIQGKDSDYLYIKDLINKAFEHTCFVGFRILLDLDSDGQPSVKILSETINENLGNFSDIRLEHIINEYVNLIPFIKVKKNKIIEYALNPEENIIRLFNFTAYAKTILFKMLFNVAYNNKTFPFIENFNSKIDTSTTLRDYINNIEDENKINNDNLLDTYILTCFNKDEQFITKAGNDLRLKINNKLKEILSIDKNLIQRFTIQNDSNIGKFIINIGSITMTDCLRKKYDSIVNTSLDKPSNNKSISEIENLKFELQQLQELVKLICLKLNIDYEL
ncbi:MAG: hypothetical protein U0354_14175 [Candidatus Sericytochromatia bacterium]